MLIILGVIIATWILIGPITRKRMVSLLSVGLIISYIIAVMASMPPIIEVSLAEDEVLRAFSPAAYPFCIQQYRNYDSHIFSYAISLGWPEGMPLLQLASQDDQSEFIHIQHYLAGLSLGLLLLLIMAVLVGILAWVDRRGMFVRRQRTSSLLLLILLQSALIILSALQLLAGSIVYFLGGSFVLLVTLYPTLQAKRTESKH